ncbi:trimeric intracellular cation channel family protein [Dietzia sp. ANT_WB102]|uniref:trimeric intracellular cation channel family protein n=1 Tax=Dietzia sp. ANT_WB102 TaxID=2597345 RepID=UPI0011ED8D3E|nr:TRIC cation channel family protein [Dietzia sp. ANT_WB102]KAA0918623.1 trimeric intracellular cation channel family protein [Dietzia sp. ANT_WB102]
METSPLLLVFDLLGVFFFALSGNLLAARKDIDITGGLVLGLLAGLGGGIIRDALLGVTPLALAQPVYLVPPVAAAVVVYLIGSHIHRVQTLIVALDAAGLGLFCTFGTARALDHGMPVASALLLGVVTAVGGGLMRDVVANEIPAVFSGSNLYVVPAATGAALTAVAVGTDTWGPVTATVLPCLVFAFRMVAWSRQWSVPAPVRSWTVRDLDVLRRRDRSVFGRPRREQGFDDDEDRGPGDEVDPGGSRGFRPDRRR